MAEKSIKCVVVGDGMVGKTCLVLRYTMGDKAEFGEYIPTVADKIAVKVNVGNVPIIFNIWDTAGQEEFGNLRKVCYPNTDVFLVCFALNSPVAFSNVAEMWLPELAQYCPDAAIILVGTKSDTRITLRNPISAINDEVITYDMGKEMAKKMKLGSYLECSAKTGEGVKAVFDMAIKACLNPKKYKRQRCHVM